MMYSVETKNGEQSGQVGAALKPLELKVSYESGDPVFQIPVKFRLISGSGQFNHRDTLTDIQGCAIAEFVPDAAGPYRIDCLVGGKGGEAVHFVGEVVPAAEAVETAVDSPETAADDSGTVDDYLDGLLHDVWQESQEKTTSPDQSAMRPATVAVPVPVPMPAPLPIPDPPAAEAVAPDTDDEQPQTAAEAVAPDTDDEQPQTAAEAVAPDTDDEQPQTASRRRFIAGLAGNPGRTALVALALVIALILFAVVRATGPDAPDAGATSATAPAGSIDCTGSPVSQVGRSYVFTACHLKP